MNYEVIIILLMLGFAMYYIFYIHDNKPIKHKKSIDIYPVNTNDLINHRDVAVLNDDLYPPLNRNPKPIANDYMRYKSTGYFDYPNRGTPDTFRLIGYMINSTNKHEKWNLFGRQKFSGSSQGEFYVVQQCSNSTCTKINLDDDILVGGKIRDFYNLPNTITLNSPLFDTVPYNIVQLKTTLDSGPYM